MTRRTKKARHKPGADWATLSRERLLDLRICDLDLRIEGSEIERHLGTLYAELALHGFVFRPHCWLSDEWFSPDGTPGFAVPFYLAHPRLKRLEQDMMLEVEGGAEEHCLELMRHETGHALANAYRLHRRRDWQRHFGKSTQQYPKSYTPKPYSKRFVVHLDNWYAQSHPDEDWAETFAVWLRPGIQLAPQVSRLAGVPKNRLRGHAHGGSPGPAAAGTDARPTDARAPAAQDITTLLP